MNDPHSELHGLIIELGKHEHATTYVHANVCMQNGLACDVLCQAEDVCPSKRLEEITIKEEDEDGYCLLFVAHVT